MAGLLFPKPRPGKLERADRKQIRESLDAAENKKVKKRSGGQCEARELKRDGRLHNVYGRCRKRACHVHHRIGGIGVRGIGVSALAINKLHLCPDCHSDIHAHVLVPDGDYFRRIK